MMKRLRSPLCALVAPLFAGLAGCSSTVPAAGPMARADMTPTGSTEVVTQSARGADLTLALAQLPDPAVVDMRERIFSNGVRQEIVLAGDRATAFGENKMIVALQSAPAPQAGRDLMQLWRPAETGIKQEIVARYPAIDMQIVTQPRRNALGTFGLAIGRHANGTRCVFAWQWVDDVRNPAGSGFGKIAAFGSSGQPLSIRVHLCRKDATVDELAAAVEGLTLAPQGTIDRVLDPSRRAPAAVIAAPVGAPSLAGPQVAASSDGTLEGALTSVVRPQRQIAAAPRPSRVRVARHVPKRPRPAPAVAADQTDLPESPVAPVYQAGPRYMAPVAGGQPAPTYAAPAYAPAQGGKPLDPSLPAVAYRGPGQRY